jgi:hypothetical protein
MFADAALAARIDRAEGRLCADMAQSVDGRRREARVHVAPFGGGVAVYGGPGSPISKVIGCGFAGPLDAGELTDLEAIWGARGEPVRFELSTLADGRIAPALVERGYRLHGFENVLARSLDRLDEAPACAAVIGRIDRSEISTWVAVAVDAFSSGDGSGQVADSYDRAALETVLGDVALTPQIQLYLARVGGEPAAEASLRVDGTLAQFGGAGTLMKYRGLGIHKALLHRRLADARAAGCELAVVVTAPGTFSQANVMRRGFELLYTRVILIQGGGVPHPASA